MITGDEGERLGSSVDISEDGSIVAAGFETGGGEGGAGLVEVFEFDIDQSTLTPQGSLIEGSVQNEHFGASLALSQDGLEIVIGAPNYSDFDNYRVFVGKVSTYKLSGDDWNQNGQKVIGVTPGIKCGTSVSYTASSDGELMAFRCPEAKGEVCTMLLSDPLPTASPVPSTQLATASPVSFTSFTISPTASPVSFTSFTMSSTASPVSFTPFTISPTTSPTMEDTRSPAGWLRIFMYNLGLIAVPPFLVTLGFLGEWFLYRGQE